MPLTTLIHVFQGAMPAALDSLSAAFRVSSQQAAAVAVAAIWQGALVACGVAIFLRFPVTFLGRLRSFLPGPPAPSHRGPLLGRTTTTSQRPAVIGFLKPPLLI